MAFRFPSRTRLVVLLVALALVTTTAAFLAIPRADAVPAHGTHVEIFDNCIDCNQIGYRHYDCDGNLVSWWGQQTGGCYETNTYGCKPEV